MEYGKFASAEELLKGYTELEKAYTHKCQQLADMVRNTDGTSEQGANCASPSEENEDAVSSVANDAETVPAPAEDAQQEPIPYTASQPPRVMSGGGSVSCALPNRPKTLREASELAKKLFE